MDKLNEVLKRLQTLDENTNKQPFISAPSPFAVLEELSAFMKELPDLLQSLEQVIIEQEELTSEQLYIKNGNGEFSAI